MANSNITTTALAKATLTIMNELITPSFNSAPLLDLTVRLGKVVEKNSRLVNFPFVSSKDSLQTVASNGTWNAPTSNTTQAFQVSLFTSPTFAIEVDSKDIIGSSQSKIEALTEEIHKGLAAFTDNLNYTIFNSATWSGATYQLPICGFKLMFPMAATGTYYGIDRAITTSIQHSYSNGSAYGGACTAVSAYFADALVAIDQMITRARIRGGNRLVLFVSERFMGYFRRWSNALGGHALIPGAPSWCPKDSNLLGASIGQIGYDTFTYNGALVVPTAGIDTTVADAYLVPFEVNGAANVTWLWNKLPTGIYGNRYKPVFIREWQLINRSDLISSAVGMCGNIVISDLSVCGAVLAGTGYSA